MNELAKVAVKAQRQAGVVSRQQLLKMGLSRDVIKRAIASRVLLKFHSGVYRMPGSPLTDETRLWAAVLWADFKAVISHRSAAWWWKLSGVGTRPPWPIEMVSSASYPVKGPRGVRVHRSRTLEKGHDWADHDGLPVTSLPRTLVDLAAVVNPSNLEKAVDSARRKHDVADEQALAALDRLGHFGRLGATKLVKVATRDPLRRTNSELEQDVRDALQRAGIRPPMPQVAQRDRHGDQIGVVDFTWPESLVILFVQSERWHRTGTSFEVDNVQMSALTAEGWRVMRVTNARLKNPRDRFFDDMRAVLAIDLKSD